MLKSRTRIVLFSVVSNMPSISMWTWIGVKPWVLLTGAEFLRHLSAIPYRFEPPGPASIAFLRPFPFAPRRVLGAIVSLWLGRAGNNCRRDRIEAILSNHLCSHHVGPLFLLDRQGRKLRTKPLEYFRPAIPTAFRCDANCVENDSDSPCRLPVPPAPSASSIPPRPARHCGGTLRPEYRPPRIRVKRRVSSIGGSS